MARAGADLVIASRRTGPIEDVATLIGQMGRRALALSVDVTDSTQVNGLFERTLHEFGKVDVLLNNAGIVRGHGATAIWEVTDDDWRLGIDTNLSGAFYCSRAIAKHMVDRGEGKIVNVSSGFGMRGTRDDYMYACGKGGVIQLTRTLATSLGRYGITSNCIVPGLLPHRGLGRVRAGASTGRVHPHWKGRTARRDGPCRRLSRVVGLGLYERCDVRDRWRRTGGRLRADRVRPRDTVAGLMASRIDS